MKKPIEITLDFDAKAALVRYVEAPYDHEPLELTDSGGVVVKFDADENVAAIEILWFDSHPEFIALAAAYAAANGLAFPRDLAGCLPVETPAAAA
jgi:hypothetical protein